MIVLNGEEISPAEFLKHDAIMNVYECIFDRVQKQNLG